MPKVKVIGKAKQNEFKPNENQIAEAFVEFVRRRYPHFIRLLVKIDNEGKCSWQLGKQKKRQGKQKGASDYFFAKPKTHRLTKDDGTWSDYLFYGLWLELKTHKGKESLAQKEFGQLMIAQGYVYECVYSLDEAIAVFEEYVK